MRTGIIILVLLSAVSAHANGLDREDCLFVYGAPGDHQNLAMCYDKVEEQELARIDHARQLEEAHLARQAAFNERMRDPNYVKELLNRKVSK